MIVRCVNCGDYTDMPRKVETFHGTYYLCPVCYVKFSEMFDEFFDHYDEDKNSGA